NGACRRHSAPADVARDRATPPARIASAPSPAGHAPPRRHKKGRARSGAAQCDRRQSTIQIVSINRKFFLNHTVESCRADRIGTTAGVVRLAATYETMLKAWSTTPRGG